MEHLPSSVVDDVATRDDIATDDNACDWPCCLTLSCVLARRVFARAVAVPRWINRSVRRAPRLLSPLLDNRGFGQLGPERFSPPVAVMILGVLSLGLLGGW